MAFAPDHGKLSQRQPLMPSATRAPCPGATRPLVAGIAWAALAAATLSAASCLAAGWATYQVDDSMSQLQAPSAALRWRNPLPSRNTLDQLEATMQVRVVLNLSPWVGKQARVYMVMPSLAQSSLAVQWTTTGLLAPGRLSGGQRQLVYQGIVPGARIEDTLRVTVLADARDAATPARVNFTFEIEVPSP